MQTANVINNGAIQTVQLPEGFHVDGNEVYIKHMGKSVLLIPKNANPWDMMTESLDQFTDDYMLERCQPVQQQREGAFE